MRLAGWLFLLAGLVLCLSVVWATVGLLLMGVGLIALRAAERQRQRAAELATHTRRDAVSFDAGPRAAATPALREPVLHEQALHEPALREPALHEPVLREPVLREPALLPLKAADTARWRELVQNDPDISRLVAILAPHGASYVEQFATDYLAVDDKAALPAILERIIARASTDKAETVRSAETVRPVEPRIEVSPAPVQELRQEPQQEPRPEPRLEPVFDAEPAPAPATRIEPVVTAPATTPDHAEVEAITAAPASAEAANAAPVQAEALDTEIVQAVSDVAAESAAAAPADIPPEPRKSSPPERPVTADDHFADLFEKFAPDSGFLTRGLGAQKPV